MRRMVSVWLPRFLTGRIERSTGGAEAPREGGLLAVTNAGKGGKRLIAVNAAAAAAGVRPGMLLTDACAIAPQLEAVPHDKRAADAGLARLARWCRRFSPLTAPDGTDGIWLDATGAAHLFGGEAALLESIEKGLAQHGFTARAAMAGTLAAAWALARYSGRDACVAPPGAERQSLAHLPVRSLNIGASTALLLERLGLRSIGQLYATPRDALRARFGTALADRLDQALGETREARASLPYEPQYAGRLAFPEPMVTLGGIDKAAAILIERVTARLKAHGKAARHFTLSLSGTQGECFDLTLATSRASAAPQHILKLLRERFRALEGRFDPASGFDAALFYASRVEIAVERQNELMADGPGEKAGDAVDTLLDRLTARLGSQAVTRFRPRESHLPERAAVSVPVLTKPAARSETATTALPRPLMLLLNPEIITAMAEVPDYPPRRFTWRGVSHKVAKAEGPERVSPEWWKAEDGSAKARDYYRVEDEAGRRFWLYREGLYDAGNAPRWFMHGLFA
jgi:protein ImuB